MTATLASIAADARTNVHGAPVLLRRATFADVPALRALHRAALAGLARGHYTARQVDSLLRHLPTLDQTLISDRTYFVAEAAGRIVACGGWSARVPAYQRVLDAVQPAANDALHPVLIRAMYTDPAWSRRGLARRILAAAEDDASGESRPIELDALLPGVPLYLKAGYLPLRTHALVMPDGEAVPVVRMRKPIPWN